MLTIRYRLRGPNVRLAGLQFRLMLKEIVQDISHAIESELIDRSPGTGNLINAWDVGMIERDGWPVGLVINAYSTPTGIPIMILLEEGSGIYGPTGEVIRPKEATVLHWEREGQHYFAAWVRGIDPEIHAFVEESMEAAIPEIEKIIADKTRGWYKDLPVAE